MGADQTTQPQVLLTPAQAAERLNVSRTKVYELMNEGRLKKVELGLRCTRIPAAAVEALAAGHT